jgi:hypothetical protein
LVRSLLVDCPGTRTKRPRAWADASTPLRTPQIHPGVRVNMEEDEGRPSADRSRSPNQPSSSDDNPGQSLAEAAAESSTLRRDDSARSLVALADAGDDSTLEGDEEESDDGNPFFDDDEFEDEEDDEDLDEFLRDDDEDDDGRFDDGGVVETFSHEDLTYGRFFDDEHDADEDDASAWSRRRAERIMRREMALGMLGPLAHEMGYMDGLVRMDFSSPRLPRSGTPTHFFPPEDWGYGYDDEYNDDVDHDGDDNRPEDEVDGDDHGVGEDGQPQHEAPPRPDPEWRYDALRCPGLPMYDGRERWEHRLNRLQSNDPRTEMLTVSASDVIATMLDHGLPRNSGGTCRPGAMLGPCIAGLFAVVGREVPIGKQYLRRLKEGLEQNATVSLVEIDLDPGPVYVRDNNMWTVGFYLGLNVLFHLDKGVLDRSEYPFVGFLVRLGTMVSALKNISTLVIGSIRSPILSGEPCVDCADGAVMLLEGARSVPGIVLQMRSDAAVRPTSLRYINRSKIANTLVQCHHSTLQRLTVHLEGEYHCETVVGRMRAICQAVPSLSCLVELSIDNRISHGDCTLVQRDLEACFGSTSLRKLSISNIQVDDDDLAAAAERLTGSSVLELLELEYGTRPCSLSHNGVVRFVRALSKNVSLKELHLPRCFRSNAAPALLDALKANHGLTSLEFPANPEPETQHAMHCVFAMNAAGRAYMRTQPTNVRKAIEVLSSVRDYLDYIYLHVRENPLAFQSLCSQYNAGDTDPASKSSATSTTDHKENPKSEWAVVHKTNKRHPRK